MRSCTARMKFLDVTALEDSTVTLNDNQQFCNAGLFREQTSQRDYATLERNQFVLDGTKEILPDVPKDVALWTGEKSSEVCAFETVASAVVKFTNPHSSAGITLYFAGRYPTSVRLTWYTLEGSVLDSRIYHPDSTTYVCKNMVRNYGGLMIELLETQFPDSYARIQYVLYGLELNWDENVIKKAKITEDSDLTSSTLPENTATVEIIDENNDFDIENMDGAWRAVQNSQEVNITAILNGKEYSAGTFYINDFSFKKNVATFNMTNSIGLLDGQIFYDSEMYVDTRAGKILEQIFAAAGFEKYEISEDVYNTELSGYLGIKSCRECIKAICFACGAIANDSRSDILKIYYQDRYVKHTVGTDRKILGETGVSLEAYVSGVSIECGRYTAAAEPSEIYNDTLEQGTTRITFNMPYDAESIVVEGGICVKASVNYVDIYMENAGACIVKGTAYEEKGFTYQKTVDLLPAGAMKNIKKFGKCSLYSAEKLPEIAKKLLDYYSLQKILKMKFFSETERSGEWLNVTNIGGATSYTLLEKHSIDLTGGFISTATCRGYNKSVTKLYFTGSELYAGGIGLI